MPGTVSEKNRNELSSIRETVESIWVAIVLAFVLRGFFIEAFVIPTGSMAPRLMGEHWDLRCPACGWRYSFGVDRRFAESAEYARGRPQTPTDAECPNCRKPYPYTRRQALPSGGDRVLVMKYLYQFKEPAPWDVVVFKNPQDNLQNYIKRLVGLPGETLAIVHGDVFVANSRDGPFRIRRKSDAAQEAMWQVVYDNDYSPVEEWRREGKSPRWTARAGGPWKLAAEGGRTFLFDGSDEPAAVQFDGRGTGFLPNYGYNPGGASAFDQARDICTDVKLSFVLVPGREKTSVALETTSLGMAFRAVVDTAGRAELLARQDGREWRSWGEATLEAMEPNQPHRVALSHVDFRVTVWVDGEPVLRTTDDQYAADYERLVERMSRARTDPIEPPEVRIEAAGGECRLMHIRLMRDEFYTRAELGRPGDAIWQGPLGDYARAINRAHDVGVLSEADYRHPRIEFGEPGWGTTSQRRITLGKFPDNPDLDEFFCLGDNSPQSLDGRGWVLAAPSLRLYRDDAEGAEKFLYQLGTVPRYNMIGKALFVYWPSGFRLPGLPNLPIIPNVGKMRLIR